MEDWTEKGEYSLGVNLEDVIYMRLGQSVGGPESSFNQRMKAL